MKKVICFLLTMLFAITNIVAQNSFDYDASWLKVDDYIDKQLPKYASQITDEIEKHANIEHNSRQIIAVALYRYKISSLYEDDYLEKAIFKYENYIKESAFPEKNIYYSLAAQLFSRYADYNFNKLSQNIEISEEYNTWNREDFIKKASGYYLKSLDNTSQLQEIPTNSYKYILVDKDNPYRYLRPSLYDILAYRAISFFANYNNNLLGYNTDNKNLLYPFNVFLNTDLSSVSDNDFTMQALKIFQTVLKEHYDEPDIFIDNELKRLNFVYNNLKNYDDKDEIYLQSLFSLERKYSQHKAVASVLYAIANFYYNNSNKYQPEISDEHKYALVSAISYCEKAISQFPDTNDGKNCFNLKHYIERKEITNIELAEANYPLESFPALVSFKNLNNIFFKIVRLDYENEYFNYYSNPSARDEYLSYLLNKPAVKEWNVIISDSGFYRNHKVEIIVPPLECGAYCILASTSKNFNIENNVVISNVFQITKINASVIEQNLGKEFTVVDRNSGLPLKNVILSLYEVNGFAQSRKVRLAKQFKTDNNGVVFINKSDAKPLFPTKSYSYIAIIVSNDKDNFAITNSYINFSNPKQYLSSEHTSIFTDRNIYKPGQKVFYKTITYSRNDNTYCAIENKKISIFLKDINQKNIFENEAITNIYGSYSGEFILPDDCPPGIYSIIANNYSASFKVEKYKKPTFEIQFSKQSEQNIANDNMCIDVFVTAYSGLPVDNAFVKYSIKRTSIFPVYLNRIRTNDVTISAGDLYTNNTGKASICFQTLCPTNIHNPIYSFIISVDVTDISGETISKNFTVNVSEQSMFISLKDRTDNSDSITFIAKDIDNNTINTNFNIKLYDIKYPEQKLRQRLWDNPDMFAYSKEEFKQKLPLDPYSNENLIEHYQKSALILDIDNSNGVLNLKNLKLKSGYYFVEVSTIDAFGNNIKDDFYFKYQVTQNSYPSLVDAISLICDKDLFHNDTLAFNLYSTHKKTNLQLIVYSNKRVIYNNFVELNDVKPFLFPLKEDDIGKVNIIALANVNNRTLTQEQTIIVSDKRKLLDLQLVTKRDFLTPTTKEQWTLSLKDYNKKPINAELLVSMYDKSLDYFAQGSNYQFENYYYSGEFFFRIEKKFPIATHYIVFYNNTFVDKTTEIINYDNFNFEDDSNLSFSKRGLQVTSPGHIKSKNTVFAQATSGIITDESSYIASDTNKGEFISSDTEVNYSANDVRSSFVETAFFYPNLYFDDNGLSNFSFTVPESITKWKFRAFAHTKSIASANTEYEVISKKDLFVQANNPKVLYEGDTIEYYAKISNLSDNTISGKASIDISDIYDNIITNLLVNKDNFVDFIVEKNSSAYVHWKLFVPNNNSLLKISCSAETSAHKDVEVHYIPVLSTKALITESLPFFIADKGTVNIKFTPFISKFGNPKLSSQAYTLEYTANPIWYAIQSLPFLSINNDISSLSLFNKLYANVIAKNIINSYPEIKEVYEKLKITNPESLTSKLYQNKELKDISLSETTWINNADIDQQIASLFDKNYIDYSISAIVEKLNATQLTSGAFPWIEGSYLPSYYITLNVMKGFADLKSLGFLNNSLNCSQLIAKSLNFLDSEALKIYNEFNNKENKYAFDKSMVLYLYIRNSFSEDYPVDISFKACYDFFLSKLEKSYTKFDIETQSLVAIILHRTNNSAANVILKSFEQRAIHDKNIGMYWRDLNKNYSYSSSISCMASMIQCFSELSPNSSFITEMQQWLLNNKRTNAWESGIATSRAIFALLINSEKKIPVSSSDLISIGDYHIDSKDAIYGSTYIKKCFYNTEIAKNFGDISIVKTNNYPAWGAVYWQYVTDYSNVESSSAGLYINREILKYDKSSLAFSKLKDNETIYNTDKIAVRLLVKVDRDYEYVYIKDILPSCFISEQQLSDFIFKSGLHYYMSINNDCVNFYIEHLPKGNYVIEYAVNIQQSGFFSAGFSKIQSLYAPEFSGQSKSININIVRQNDKD